MEIVTTVWVPALASHVPGCTRASTSLRNLGATRIELVHFLIFHTEEPAIGLNWGIQQAVNARFRWDFTKTSCAAGVVTKTTDRNSLRYTHNGTRRVRQLALGCESN